MYVTVTYPGYHQTLSYVAAVAVIAAGLRAGHTVTVTAADEPTRWAFTPDHRTVCVEAVNPDLFTLGSAPPVWVGRLATTTAPLL